MGGSAAVAEGVLVPAEVPHPDVEAGVGEEEAEGVVGVVGDPVGGAALEPVLEEGDGSALADAPPPPPCSRDAVEAEDVAVRRRHRVLLCRVAPVDDELHLHPIRTGLPLTPSGQGREGRGRYGVHVYLRVGLADVVPPVVAALVVGVADEVGGADGGGVVERGARHEAVQGHQPAHHAFRVHQLEDKAVRRRRSLRSNPAS